MADTRRFEARSYAIKQLRDRPGQLSRTTIASYRSWPEQGVPVPSPYSTDAVDTVLRLGGDW